MNKNKIWIGVTLGLISAGVITYILKDTIQEFLVEPLYYVASMFILIFGSFPQQYVWGFLVFVGIIIYASSLSKRRIKTKLNNNPPIHYRGYVETWARWLEMSTEGEIFKTKLARELGELSIRTIAYRNQHSIIEIRKNIKEGKYNLPPEVREIINTEPPESRMNVNPLKLIVQRLRRNTKKPLQDLHLEKVFKYLEAELEV